MSDDDKKTSGFPDDSDKTIATNIEDEPTVVVAPKQKGVTEDTGTESQALDLADENTKTENTAPDNEASPDDEPTVVFNPEADDKEPDEDEEEVKFFSDSKAPIKINLEGAESTEREDPRKIRSVTGTFKVYVLREGKSEEFVFEGLRKKDYTEKEITMGYEAFLGLQDEHTPSLAQRARFFVTKITNLLNKKK